MKSLRGRKPVLFVVLAVSASVLGGCRGQGDTPAPAKVVATVAEEVSEARPQDELEVTSPPAVSVGPGARLEDELNTMEVFEKMAPATVFVSQSQLAWSQGLTPSEVPAGAGTGFVWDDKGHVVTNFHVVAGGEVFTVRLYNQKSYKGTFVGGDPRKDIAVLRIDAPDDEITPVVLPPKDYELRVGQKTLAIGNPFGLEHTLTTGIVSALEREVVGYSGLTIRGIVQTDASINPGNSGGPLLDSAGQLLGMNTMILSRSGTSAGIGFAVPVSIIRSVVPQLIKDGKAEQVGLGISTLSDAMARRAGIKGVIIRSVLPDSPAEEAGLKGMTTVGSELVVGDVIVAIDDTAVTKFDDLYTAIDGKAAGTSVDVAVLRDRKKKVIKVKVYVLP